MSAPLKSRLAVYRLGELQVEPSIGRISGPGGTARLEPRVMAVLEALARRPGQLVSRSELLSNIWPGSEVYDEALTQSVYQLRQQLLSAGGHESYRDLITTVPKRGYVLEGIVESLEVEPAKANSSRSLRSSRAGMGALAGVAALVVIWMAYQRPGDIAPPRAVPTATTVAVLPFVPLIEDQHEPVLELGMADTLITRLSGIGELVIRPMSSVRRYADVKRDALVAGRELGVETVVDGSLQFSNGALRVGVRLLRVSDGTALWGETLSAPISDIFTVQDEITTRIAQALSLELGQEVRVPSPRGSTANTDAYEHYLRGRYHLARLTPDDLRQSVERFRAAVALDPEYTQAWLGLANAQFRIPIAGQAQPLEYYPLASEAARRALALDPSSAEAHAMLGWIAHWFEWDWAASEAHFKRAIELDPRDTESHLGYAHLLSSTGRYDQAIEEVRRARELSPLYPVAVSLEGGFLMWAGRVEEALLRLEAARPVGDNFWLYHVSLAGAYSATGRTEEALEEYRQARIISGDSTYAVALEIGMLARMGRQAEAEALFDSLAQRVSTEYVPPFDLAVAHRGLGDLDAALAMLLRAYELHDPKLALMGVGGWRSLDDRAEYRDLRRKMGFEVTME